MSLNSLYQLYLQQTNRQPLSQLATNNQQASAAQTGDTNFQDLWNYLKWARRGYDLYSKVSGSPTSGQYLNKGWDWLTNSGDTATGAGGEALGEAGVSGAEASQELGSMGYEASPYYTGAATTAASEGSGLAGLSAGGYAQVAAPLVMAYLKYQAGSGRNEPVEKTADTQKTARLLSDILKEKNIDWSNTENQYGLKPKYLSSEITGIDQDNPNQMVDPRGWTAKDLYDRMLEQSTQYYQTGGVGSSLYNGNQINEMFGDDQGKLAEAMGLPSLPDWSFHDKGSGFSPEYLSNDPTGRAIAAQVGKNPYDEQWNTLDEPTKYNYTRMDLNPDKYGGYGRNIWEQDQATKELNDKYKLGLKSYAERLASRNQWF